MAFTISVPHRSATLPQLRAFTISVHSQPTPMNTSVRPGSGLSQRAYLPCFKTNLVTPTLSREVYPGGQPHHATGHHGSELEGAPSRHVQAGWGLGKSTQTLAAPHSGECLLGSVTLLLTAAAGCIPATAPAPRLPA